MPEGGPGTVVFAGPTLPPSPRAAWRELLAGCALRPPAQRGDVLAALAGRPHTVVLIDGYFYSVPAVTHKELLYALDAGVRVIGAASLGALRAAELAPGGMIGVGQVFRWYRDGAIDGDDEVAVLHLPHEYHYRPTTVALVELRHALTRLARREAVAADAAERLLAAGRRLPFTERTPERILELAAAHLGDGGRRRLERALAAPGLKRRDAACALRYARRPPATASPRRRRPTLFLNAFLECYARPPSTPDSPPPSFGEAWTGVQVLHPRAASFVGGCRRRALLAAAARDAGLSPPAAQVEAACRRLETHLEAAGLAAALPATEVLAEARQAVRAEGARSSFGSVERACRTLAANRGLPAGGERTLVERIEEGSLPLSSWDLTRAFVFSSALLPALALARAAAEVYRCFERRFSGSRITEAELARLAAVLWRCGEDGVASAAARRGLSPGSGIFPGLREALERLAPAERLAAAINDYPKRRAELRSCSLRHVLSRRGSATGGAAGETAAARPMTLEV